MEQNGYTFITKKVSNPAHRKEFFQQEGTGTPVTVVVGSNGVATSVQGFQRKKLEKMLKENI